MRNIHRKKCNTIFCGSFGDLRTLLTDEIIAIPSHPLAHPLVVGSLVVRILPLYAHLFQNAHDCGIARWRDYRVTHGVAGIKNKTAV